MLPVAVSSPPQAGLRTRYFIPAARRVPAASAPFVVLIGARMPSVLTEISFLSNKSEAGLLEQANHRERIAQALLEGILKYQAALKKVSAVAAR